MHRDDVSRLDRKEAGTEAPSLGQFLSWKLCADQRALIILAGIGFAVYLAIGWWLLAPGALWSPDEGAKLLQLRFLRIEDGRLAFSIPYAGQAFDPDWQFARWELLSIRNESFSFGRLPLFAMFTRPLVDLGGLAGLTILPALGGALVGVLTLQWLPPEQRRIWFWLLIAVGSPVLVYATIFWEHTLASSLVLAAGVLLLRYVAPTASGRWQWPARLGVALLFALGAYMRPETVLFSGALLIAIWLVMPASRWPMFWLGALTALLLLPYIPLHRALFAGQPLPDNASHIFVPFAYIRGAGMQAFPDLFVGPFTHGAINSGWLGWVWAAAALLAIASGFLPLNGTVRHVLFLALALSAMVAAFFLLIPEYYRSAHGLLFTTPWALIGLSRSRDIWSRGTPELRVLLLTVLIGLLAYALAILVIRGSSPHGGLQWGARFALTFYSPLVILTLWGWQGARLDDKLITVMTILCLLGVGMQLRGLQLIQADKQYNQALNTAIAATPARYVLSDLTWLPLNAAPIYDHKAWFVAHTPEAAVDWLEQAADQQLAEFSLVTNRDSALIDIVNRALPGLPFEIRDVQYVLRHGVILQFEHTGMPVAPAGSQVLPTDDDRMGSLQY